MNEDAINDAFRLFAAGGYNKGIEDFKILISTNPNALSDAHALFSDEGYNGNIDEFSELVGVKKKEETLSNDSEIPAEVLPKNGEQKTNEEKAAGAWADYQKASNEINKVIDPTDLTTMPDMPTDNLSPDVARANIEAEINADFAPRAQFTGPDTSGELKNPLLSEEPDIMELNSNYEDAGYLYRQGWKQNFIEDNPDVAKNLQSDDSEIVDAANLKIANAFKEVSVIPFETTDGSETSSLGKMVDAFGEGMSQDNFNMAMAAELATATDDEAKIILEKIWQKSIKESNDIQTDFTKDPELLSAEGVSGMLGGQATTIGGTVLLSATLTPAAGLAYATTKGAYTNYAAEFMGAYQEARALGKNVEDAYEIALTQSKVGFVVGGIENAVGVGTGKFATKLGVKAGEKFATKLLKPLIVKAAEGTSDMGLDASVAAIGTLVSNSTAIAQGLDRGLFDGVTDAMVGEIIFSGVMKGKGTFKTVADFKKYVKALPPKDQQAMIDGILDNADNIKKKVVLNQTDGYLNLLKKDNPELRKEIEENPVDFLLKEKARYETKSEFTTDKTMKDEYGKNIEALNMMMDAKEAIVVDGKSMDPITFNKKLEDPEFIKYVIDNQIDVGINNNEGLVAKYKEKLGAAMAETAKVEETKKDKSEVERLRQEEQAELLEAIPDAKNYLTDGKVDKEKITNPEDITKFEEIYNKYDKVISPLLGNKKTEADKGKQIISFTQDTDGNVVPVLAPIAESPTGKKYDAKDTENVGSKKKMDAKPYASEEVVEIGDDKLDEFVESQAEATSQRTDESLQVTPVTKESLQKIKAEGGKVFMTSDGKSGGYVSKDGYMGGLFKQPNSGRRGAAKVLQEARINSGGKFFDAFGINKDSGEGTNLEEIYIKNGFRPVARMTFNPEFAPEGWEGTNLKSKPDNVFFVYDPSAKSKPGDGVRIEDYDTAYETAKQNAESKTQDAEGNAEPIKQDTKTEWDEWSDNPEGWEGGKIFDSKKGNTAVEYEGEKMPENATKKSIRIYRKALESNTDKETAANMALENMKKTKWYEKLNESKAESFDADFVTSLGGKPAKVPTIVSKKKQMKAIDAEIKSRKESGKKNPAWKDISDADLDAQKEKIETESNNIDDANEKIKAIDAEMKARKADTEKNPTLDKFDDSELALQKRRLEIKIEEMKDSNPFVRKTARTVLKEKIANLAKGAKIGSVEGKKELRAAQNEVVKYSRQVFKDLDISDGVKRRLENNALRSTRKNISEQIAKIDKLAKTTIEKKRLSTIEDIKDLVKKDKELLKKRGKLKVAKVPTDIKNFIENFDTEDLDSKNATEIAFIYKGLKDIIKGGDAAVKAKERDVANKKNEAETESFLIWHKQGSEKAKEINGEIKKIKSKLKNRANRDGESTEKLIKELEVLERRQEESFETEVSGLKAINDELGKNSTIAIVDGKIFTSESGLKKFLDHNDADLNNIKIYLKKDLNNERSSREKNKNTIKGLARRLSEALDPMKLVGNLQNNLAYLAKSSKKGRLIVEELFNKVSLAELDLEENSIRIKNTLESNAADMLSGSSRWSNNAASRKASRAARLTRARVILAKEGLSKDDGDAIRAVINSDIGLSNDVIINLYSLAKTEAGRAQLKRQLRTAKEHANIVKDEAKEKADDEADKLAEKKAVAEAKAENRPVDKERDEAEAKKRAEDRAEARAKAVDVVDAKAESEMLDIIDAYMNKEENANLKKFADFLVDDFYKTLKDRYDPMFFDLTGLHFEDGVYYPLRRSVASKDISNAESLVDGDSGETKSLKPLSGHLKQTYSNRTNLDLTRGAMGVAKDYVNTMERSKQFIPIGKRINEVFNRNAMPDIVDKMGERQYRNLQDHLVTVVTGKSPRKGSKLDNKWINGLMGIRVFASLAGKPASIPKQLTSAARFTSAEDVSMLELSKTLAKVPTKLERELMMEIIKSDYVVNRFEGAGFDIETARIAKMDGNLSLSGFLKTATKAGMLPIAIGDIGGVLIGGVPYALTVYRKAIDAKMTHEQAKKHAYDRFRMVSNSTQQSSQNSQVSHMQRSDIGRLFSMYTTSQKQGFNKMVYSSRMLAWNTDLSKTEKTRHMYNVLFYAGENMFFAGVANEFFYSLYKYMTGEEDDEEKIKRGIYDTVADNAQSVISGGGYNGVILNALINEARGQDWKNELSISQELKVLYDAAKVLSAVYVESKPWEELTDKEIKDLKGSLHLNGFFKTLKNFEEYEDGTKNLAQAIMNWQSEEQKKESNRNYPRKDIFYKGITGEPYTPEAEETDNERIKRMASEEKKEFSRLKRME